MKWKGTLKSSITNVKGMAIPAKKEFANLAPSHRAYRWRRLSNYWARDVGIARPCNHFHTSRAGYSGDRISMG